MNKRELICIGCPIGCNITVTLDNNEVVDVTGNTCKIGDNYARKECTHPTRIVTSIVNVANGNINMVPCKTESDIPKELIFDILYALKDLKVVAPVKVGDILLENACNTGVNVIATRSVKLK